jgi:formylglycine-generating enzyme required for sulfatase activity
LALFFQVPPVSFDLLKCVGKAVVKYGLKGLAECVPFGNVLYDMAGDALEWWKQRKPPAERRAELAALAQAPAEEIRRQAAQAVQEVAADQPEPVRQALTAYLTQVPVTVRTSLRRPADPTGTTVPAGLALDKPEDLLVFLPARLPRFKPGDRPLPGVPWQLLELLGVGGFGEVWKAHNPRYPGLVVALKFCLDAAVRDRLLDHEADIVAQVLRQGKHPGIVELRQAYLEGDPPCLEYEYVEGGDLAGLIQERQPHGGLPPASALQVMQRLAEPIAFAHGLKPPIVHRDLKPANILVRRSADRKLSFKVADFGIGDVAASQALAEVTRRGSSLLTALRGSHTPLYASPQQKRGEKGDRRDDVYALGVIWYQLLTGDLGAEAPSGLAWPRRLQQRGVSEAMIHLLAECIEPRLEDRLPSAVELAERLADLDPTPPPPPPVPKKPETLKEITNSIGMQLALIPSGTFLMGSPDSEAERSDNQGPRHQVTITRPFYLGVYPVTQRPYAAVMGINPASFNEANGGGPDHPVENVSWDEAVEFCKRLSDRPEEKQSGRVYGLPTEAEWEYACRGGASFSSPFHYGASLSSTQANFDGNHPYGGAARGPYLQKTSKVGSYKPNAFGLFDLHGNVWEWCHDWYGEKYYASGEIRILKVLKAETAACCAAARGTTMPGAAAPPPASGTRRRTATTM